MHTTIASVLLLTCPTLQAAAQTDGLRITVRVERTAGDKGGELVVSAEAAEGWALWRDPLMPTIEPGILLRVGCPARVELAGKPVQSAAALQRAGYLDTPHEHLLRGAAVRVAFRADATAAPDSVFALEFIAYLLAPGEATAQLVRRELELPLRPGARARLRTGDRGSGQRSQARATARLALGDRFPALSLARVFGPELELRDRLPQGAGILLVSTYHSCL